MSFNTQGSDSNWLSLADMMTALMIIFMFIALNYILQYVDHNMVENEIYNKLETKLEEEIENDQIELGPNGSVRFHVKKKDKKLFKIGNAQLTPYFKETLRNFLPKYWSVLNSKPEYFDYIEEIRIEGHADSRPFIASNQKKNYLKNLSLSQKRAKQVLAFLMEQPLYKDASKEMKERMNFLFTAIGFSFSRTINKEGKYTYVNPNTQEDKELSRRVEFRIVTSNDKLAKEIDDKNE